MNLQMKLAGPSMAELYPLTGVLLPDTPPYETHGRLLGKKGDDDRWTFTYDKFSGKVGASDIAGTLAYVQRAERPLLRGTLTSQQLRLTEPSVTTALSSPFDVPNIDATVLPLPVNAASPLISPKLACIDCSFGNSSRIFRCRAATRACASMAFLRPSSAILPVIFPPAMPNVSGVSFST